MHDTQCSRLIIISLQFLIPGSRYFIQKTIIGLSRARQVHDDVLMIISCNSSL